MDQRIGVDQLQRAGGGQRERERLRRAAVKTLGRGLRRREGQHRTQPLAAGEQTVAHRLPDDGRLAIGRHEAFERLVDGRGHLGAHSRVDGVALLRLVGQLVSLVVFLSLHSDLLHICASLPL